MSKKLAIKGHPTRGNEVIEILKMMGGEAIRAKGNDETAIYVIPVNGIIDVRYTYEKRIDNYAIFTLEEFWKKYPFKVGDKVIDSKTGKIAEVYKIHWSENNSCVYYDIKYSNNHGRQRRVMELQSYKEETNLKENTILNMSAIDYNNGLVGYEIPEGYEFDTVIDNKVVLKKLKLTYPTTYKECCDVLKIPNDERYIDIDVPLDYNKLLSVFTELLICRKAYYKIAGEQMGLGKPWEPDWDNLSTNHEFIKISNGCFTYSSRVLVFPTAEMRDAFYENFKDLIEQCKELL